MSCFGAVEIVLAYHERTKHLPGRFARSLGYMDWDTQPDPFRRFAGAPLMRLDLVPINDEPTYERAFLEGAPREHALERRAELPAGTWAQIAQRLPPNAVLIGLSSIHWREAWKYGERAFRYCQHDVGHAIACMAVAAAGLGWDARLLEGVDDDTVSALLTKSSAPTRCSTQWRSPRQPFGVEGHEVERAIRWACCPRRW